MNRFLEEALDLAERGLGRVSPNPAVGALIVRDGNIIGRGFYRHHCMFRKMIVELVLKAACMTIDTHRFPVRSYA